MLSRNLQKRVKDALEHFPVVALLGARQSGKTTLARMQCPEWKYFDLERASDLDFVTRDFDFFFAHHPNGIVFDEVQNCPPLLRELRGVIDADRGRKGRFLLTGSSAPSLLKGISESLAGRIAIIEVGTLKLNEIRKRELSDFYRILAEVPSESQFEHLQKLVPQFSDEDMLGHFLHGGYPEPILSDASGFFETWMANYERTYLDRDVRGLFPRLDARSFQRFLRMLADLSGTIINRCEVARSLGCSESAVRDYLEIAEGTFLWRSISSLEKTISKSLVKMPRGYIRDSGLLHHLQGVRTIDQVLSHPRTGAAFEGHVVEQILLGLQAVEKIPWESAYYRTRSGAEVDLVLTSPCGLRIPVEIKFGMSIRTGDLRSLAAFVENENCPYGIIVNNAPEVRLLAARLLQIPATCL